MTRCCNHLINMICSSNKYFSWGIVKMSEVLNMCLESDRLITFKNWPLEYVDLK